MWLEKHICALTHLLKYGIFSLGVISMTKINGERERLSIDVLAQEHRQIKTYAAIHGETIREYVLKSVHERLRREAEEKEATTKGSSKPYWQILSANALVSSAKNTRRC